MLCHLVHGLLPYFFFHVLLPQWLAGFSQTTALFLLYLGLNFLPSSILTCHRLKQFIYQPIFTEHSSGPKNLWGRAGGQWYISISCCKGNKLYLRGTTKFPILVSDWRDLDPT